MTNLAPTAASTTAAPTETAISSRTVPLWRTGALAAIAAALTTTAIAALSSSAGVPLKIDGKAIPPFAFAQMTSICAVIGIVLAVALRRWAATPKHTFTVTTIVLTVLSFLPDLIVPAAASTRIILMLTHLAAAAIVIPLLAGRLPARTR